MTEFEKKPHQINRKLLFRERNPNLIAPGRTSVK